MFLKKLIITSILILFFTTCTLTRMIIYNFADMNDYKIFPYRKISKPIVSFKFHESNDSMFGKRVKITLNNNIQSIDEFLNGSHTLAFLIIRNDTLLYEKYFYRKDASSVFPSFSMAKSVVSILVGIAADEGVIHSVNDPITNYLPELKKRSFEKVTIEHLLQMTSGLKFSENYFSPFSDAAKYYYGNRLRKYLSKVRLKDEPGKKFEYNSGNTQLLGLVLERALKNKTLSQYAEEKLWHPLQMEFDATWSTDRKKNGMEKAFCCLNARARDFAKIGRLYLNKGYWNGKPLVSENWVKRSTQIDTSSASAWFYQYQWWIPSYKGDFMAEGHLGQFIYVYPKKNLIIVRLGKRYGKIRWWNVMRTLRDKI
ncbi:MAG: beta-lactamase family protein [Bacteroidia bacterium]|nr:beta-lactamase family protein [Bacteroidia bacterium]